MDFDFAGDTTKVRGYLVGSREVLEDFPVRTVIQTPTLVGIALRIAAGQRAAAARHVAAEPVKQCETLSETV